MAMNAVPRPASVQPDSGVTPAQLNAALAGKANKSEVPTANPAAPMPEMVGGKAGVDPRVFDAKGHSHPRVVSATYAMIKANGLSDPVMFTQQFNYQPCLVLTAVDPGGTQPPQLVVDSWIKDGTNFVGCVVKGYRARLLPQNNQLTGIALLTALVTGVNNLIATLDRYNLFGGSAQGLEVSVVAIKRSDVT